MVEQCLLIEKRLNDEDQDQIIDMFKFRVMVLCITRGTTDFKAHRLFDLVIGKEFNRTQLHSNKWAIVATMALEKEKKKNEQIMWSNKKLRSAIRTIVSLAFELPKILVRMGQSADSEVQFTDKSSLHQQLSQIDEWSPQQIEIDLSEFEIIFQEIFETKFIDKLFTDPAVLFFDRDKFIEAMVPSLAGAMFDFMDGNSENDCKSHHEGGPTVYSTMGDGECDWLFSLVKVRKVYLVQKRKNLK